MNPPFGVVLYCPDISEILLEKSNVCERRWEVIMITSSSLCEVDKDGVRRQMSVERNQQIKRYINRHSISKERERKRNQWEVGEKDKGRG